MIQLRRTREWSGEHREEEITGSVRLYVGQLFCGVAEPDREEPDKYHFHAAYDFITIGVGMPTRAESLEYIKVQLELTLKEFANKFCYTKQQINESKD